MYLIAFQPAINHGLHQFPARSYQVQDMVGLSFMRGRGAVGTAPISSTCYLFSEVAVPSMLSVVWMAFELNS
jgi:hypothetical protein